MQLHLSDHFRWPDDDNDDDDDDFRRHGDDDDDDEDDDLRRRDDDDADDGHDDGDGRKLPTHFAASVDDDGDFDGHAGSPRATRFLPEVQQ